MTHVHLQPFGRRNPWSGAVTLQNQMNRLFGQLFQGEDEDAQVSRWMPRVNVADLEDKIELTAELPGLAIEDVKVELHNNVLTISGEKKNGEENDERKLHLCERAYGAFRRSFQLPSEVQADAINAEFENGVLFVTLPKKEEVKPKQIEVTVK
ncbi:MAG: Hsp20/alpha crystallin family protein [Candidatus Electryoneaceae bacterium]|nr:Hsp20/alpha crystallin family protein [Candidatus Electryoneaceae bacterium]